MSLESFQLILSSITLRSLILGLGHSYFGEKLPEIKFNVLGKHSTHLENFKKINNFPLIPFIYNIILIYYNFLWLSAKDHIKFTGILSYHFNWIQPLIFFFYFEALLHSFAIGFSKPLQVLNLRLCLERFLMKPQHLNYWELLLRIYQNYFTRMY